MPRQFRLTDKTSLFRARNDGRNPVKIQKTLIPLNFSNPKLHNKPLA
jgi:hypothetical protein